MTTHYETLGIPREASAERVKRSYRSLVKIYHPDKFPSGSAEQAEAEKRIRDLNEAYSVLSKPANRAKYDAKLSKRPLLYWGAEPEHCARCGKPNQQATGTRLKGRRCATCVREQSCNFT